MTFDMETAERRLTGAQWAGLILIALAAMLPGFFTIPAMDRDESRYAQAAVQMMETGDYIDIRFQDQPRHVKPVGFYWMEVAAAQPFGGEDAPIWAFRIPSLFSAIIAVLATGWLGARLFGAPVGFAAGALLAISLGLQVEARTAKTDAALLAAGVIAQAALAFILVRGRPEGRPKFWGAPAVFWAASGAALLIKGPIIAMVSALTLAGYMLLQRDWGAVWRLRPLPGLVLCAAVALPWYVAITIVTEGAFFMESVGHALLGKVGEADDSHGGPIGYHTLLSPITLFPGSILLGLAGLYAWAHRREPVIQFLIVWILPTWLVFELAQTKLPHYVMPTFPAIFLLAALGLLHAKDLLTSWRQWALQGFVGVLVGLAAALLALSPGVALAFFTAAPETASEGLRALRAVFFEDPISLTAWSSLAIGLIAIYFIAATAVRAKPSPLAQLGAVTIVLYLSLFQQVIPRLDTLWPSDRAARFVDTLEGCESIPVALSGYPEPSTVFHFGTDTAHTDPAGAADHLRAFPACGLAMVEARGERDFLDAADPGAASPLLLETIEGYNAVKGRFITLRIYAAEATELRSAP